jgi:hypothetical protein
MLLEAYIHYTRGALCDSACYSASEIEHMVYVEREKVLLLLLLSGIRRLSQKRLLGRGWGLPSHAKLGEAEKKREVSFSTSS